MTTEAFAAALLAVPGRLLITAHKGPDGDAVGSTLGVLHAFREAGREALAIGVGPNPAAYDCLEGIGSIVPAEGFVPRPTDTLLVLDCGLASRLREAVAPLTQTLPTLCIDHHERSPGFGGPFLCDPKAGSTAELVCRVLQAARLPISRAAAEALWVGIATDTGRFCYDATSPATLRTTADLLETGVRTDFLADRIYGREALRVLRLRGRLVDSLELLADGRVAVAHLGPEAYAAEGCDDRDSENFVNTPRSIPGVEIAAFVRRVRPEGPCNLSLRTREGFDAAAICAEWGGGGHVRAAGATVDLPLPDFTAALARRLVELVNAHTR